jgi:7-carboxy-7-deazaguanine synthase
VDLIVCEIFHSIQGESTFAGFPCVFVRLSGCNLDCSWCDTPYSKEKGVVMSLDRILEQITSFDCPLVEITGGEPLIQDNTKTLIHTLIKDKYQVLLETNGSQSIGDIDDRCIRIVDIKCPSSNEPESFLFENITYLTPKDEIKFVIASRDDYEYAAIVIQKNLKKISAKKIHLSPVSDRIYPEKIASWMLEDKLKARLSLQQHKIIWDPDKGGV